VRRFQSLRRSQALQVEARLFSAIALPTGRDIHLDALLAWVWVLRHHPERMACISRVSRRSEILDIHLPVPRVPIGAHRVPLCSATIYPDTARLTSITWTRRKDGHDIEHRARPIASTSPERPQLNRGDAIETPSVAWLAWGRRRDVLQALKLVHHIGGLRAHGYGLVAGWSVDAIECDPAAVWIAGCRSQRNLPVEAVRVDAAHVEPLAVEPPYWTNCMWTRGVRPGVLVELTDGAREAVHAAAQ
jgi:hypothetical protein